VRVRGSTSVCVCGSGCAWVRAVWVVRAVCLFGG
jgi:hypothetical protein